jgi:thioredoxin-related protein
MLRFEPGMAWTMPLQGREQVGGRWTALAVKLVFTAAALALPIAGVLPFASPVHAAQPAQHLERPKSLTPYLERAAQQREPIVLLFSIEGCGWCIRLRRDHLYSLAAQASARGIQVIELDLNDDRPFQQVRPQPGKPAPTGWLAEIRSPYMLASRLNVRVSPTLVFLGPTGEIAERLEGYNAVDFYTAYLEQRIARARESLKNAR